MQVVKKDTDQLNAVLTLTIEPADYEEKVAKQLKDIRHKANIPGFRPGNVPASLVKKMYGRAVLGEEINKAISDGLSNYIQEQKLNILGEPLPNEEATPEIDWDNQTTFEFAFDIALAPAFDAVLTEKDELPYYDIEVKDEMVQKQVEAYAARYGNYVPAETAELNDILRGKLVEQKEGGLTKDDAVLSPERMQEEAKNLFLNAKKDDIITFSPMKAFGNEAEVASLLGVKKEELAGLADEFTFQITEITRHQAAAIDAELFAKVYGEGNIADEAAFRAKIADEIRHNFDEDANYKFGLDIRAAVLKRMEGLAFPEAFLKRWVLATNENMQADKLDEDFPKMLDELKWHLAKDQLTEHFGVKVEKEDVEAYAKEVTRMQFMQYGLAGVDDALLTQYANEMLKKEDQLRSIVERVVENKIFAACKGVVKLNHQAISHEDFGKLFEA